MSDLYIEGANWQIAVEGKYTEYARMPSQTIFEWLSDVKAGTGFMLRRTVARAWLSYIDAAVMIADVSGEREYGVLRANHAPRGIDL